MMASAGVLGQQPQTLVTGFGPLLYRVPGLPRRGTVRIRGHMGSLEGPQWQDGRDLLDSDHDRKCCDPPVHDRMPVILGPNSYYRWLDPGMRDISVASELHLPDLFALRSSSLESLSR